MRKADILIIGLGLGYQLLSSKFAPEPTCLIPYEIGLEILNVNTVCVSVPHRMLICRCPVLNVNLRANLTRLVMCFENNSGRGGRCALASLIESSEVVYGISCGNVWGIGVSGALLDDRFRAALLKYIGVDSKIQCYSEVLKQTIYNSACETVPHLSKQFLSKLLPYAD